jgi:hypothetical protein
VRTRGAAELVRAVNALVLTMAHHWLSAIPLLFWPELLATALILAARSDARRLAAWSAWLGVVVASQALGIWIATLKGWASADDLPSVVVAAFVSSLPGAIAGVWLFQFVLDTQESR